MSFARKILEWFTIALDRVKLCYSLGSLTPLWGSKWNPGAWIREARGLKTYYAILTIQSVSSPSATAGISRLVKEGFISPGWTTPVPLEAFIAIVDEHIVQGLRLRDYFSQSPSTVAEIQRASQELERFVGSLRLSFLHGGGRIAPIMIHINGPPGTGKSNLTQKLLEAIANRPDLQFPVDSSGIYHWQPGANFQDGLTHTHWAIVMDDVDHGVAADAPGTRNYVEEVVALCNDKPYPVQSANVDTKGTVFANPSVLIFVTNFQDMATEKTRFPDAFRRRVNLYVRVNVKSEYCRPGSTLLDPQKAQQAGTHDIYNLQVHRQDLMTDQEKPMSTHLNPKVSNFSELLVQTHKLFKQHIDTQMLKLRASQNCSSFCAQCGLGKDRSCSCPPVVCNVCGGADNLCTCRDLFPPIVPYVPVRPLARSIFPFKLASIRLPAFPLNFFQWSPPPPELETFELTFFTPASNLEVKRITGIVLATSATFFAAYKVLSFLTRQAVETLQGREGNSSNGLVPESWVRASQEFTPGIQPFGQVTFTKSDIVSRIAECHVVVRIPKKGKFEYMQASVLTHNVLLIPTHFFTDAEGMPTVTQNGLSFSASCAPTTRAPLATNPELTIWMVPELKGLRGIMAYLPETFDSSIRQFDEVEIYKDKLYLIPTDNQIVQQHGSMVLTTNAGTENGDCGSLYIARHNKAWRIVASHYAIHKLSSGFGGESRYTVAGTVTQIECKRVIATLGSSSAEVIVVSQSLAKPMNISDINIGPYSPKSEVWAADPRVHNLGNLHPPLAGASMKTKCKFSLFYDDLADMEIKHCGKRGYFTLPVFRGNMVGDKWVSPWTNEFATLNTANFDPQLMRIALCDYLQGIGDLDCSGYSVLTEEQAITGVPNSYVNSLNMKTSAGPPFGKGKVHYICPDNVEGSFLHPDMANAIDEIEMILETDIPSCLGLHSLKDEITKDGKHPRVFVVLPAAFNIVLKKYSSPWKSFMRANFEFFESAVGINMTSSEALKVLNSLRSISPDLSKVFDGDVKAMDKSWQSGMFEFIALMVYAMARVIGVDAYKAYRLILSVKHVTHSVKNDLFRAPQNPSGSDITVEMNGLCISLGERYVYYKSRNLSSHQVSEVNSWFTGFFDAPVPPKMDFLDFRTNVALITYGDDNLKAFRNPPAPDYLVTWREELGMVMTPADKTKAAANTLEPVDPSEISFLQRKCRYDPDIDMYVWPLSMRSITRMLITERGSSLTQADYAATILTEAHREMVYHGRQPFNEFLVRARGLAEKHNLARNPHLRLETFEHWLEVIKNGAFRTWVVGEETPYSEVDGEISYQSSASTTNPTTNMTDITPVEAREFAPTVQPVTSLSHAVGSVSSESAVQVSTARVEPTEFQKLPDAPLTDFLKRATFINRTTLEDTDTKMDLAAVITPWREFLSDPAIASRTKNYELISGTLQVIAVVTAPGGAYGRYVVTAMPNGGPDRPPFGHVAEPHNCLQTDHYVEIDIAEAENAVMQLPFIWQYDMANIESLISSTMWNLGVTCLAPVRTSVPGGSTRAYITFYANLLDDYKLAVPTFQGGRKKKKDFVPNEALKQHAPKIHAMIGEGKGSAMAHTVANLATAASAIPLIAPFSMAVAGAAETTASILSYFGFTRESEPMAPTTISMRSVTNVAHVDGVDSSDYASLSINNAITADPRVNGLAGEDGMACAEMFQRWTAVKTFTWSTSDAATDVLAQVPITPFYHSGDERQMNLTPAGFFGLTFEYWRGDMEYKFVIPVSKLHRGSLQIAYLPTSATISGDITNVSYNTIYDVSSGGDLHLDVGFIRERPYLRCTPIYDGMPIVPVGETNGFLHILVVNPLVAQATPANVEITVFARCKNMDFGMPRDEFPYVASDGVNPVSKPLQSGIYFQGAIGDDDGDDPETKVVLVSPSGPFPGDKLFFGEKIESFRALLQKPSLALTELMSPHPGTPILYPSPPPVATPNEEDLLTYANYYAAPFVGIAASERYKIFCNTSEAYIFVSKRCQTGRGNNEIITPTLTPVSFFGGNRGTEVTVPYYSPKKYEVLASEYLVGPGQNYVVIKNQTISHPDGFLVTVMHSFGPDIRIGAFRQIPTIRFISGSKPVKFWNTTTGG